MACRRRALEEVPLAHPAPGERPAPQAPLVPGTPPDPDEPAGPAGRPPEEILNEARRRLGNDADAELAETREQLGEIMMLRLERLLEERFPQERRKEAR